MRTLMKNSLLNCNIWTTFAILATLNVLDAASTAILVHKFGSIIEANPIVRYWIEVYGVTGIYMIKFVAVAFLGLTVAAIIKITPTWKYFKVTHISLWVLNIMLTAIVLHNVILVINTINT